MLFGLSFSVATFLLIALWCSSHVDWFFWYGRLPFCLSQSSVPGSLRHGFQHSHYKATIWRVDVEELIILGFQGMLWDCSTYYISWHSILWLQLFPQHYSDITSGIILSMGSGNERRRYNECHLSLAEPIPRIIPAHEHHDISDHQQLNCLFNSLFRLITKEHQNVALLALWEGNPLVTGWFPWTKGQWCGKHFHVLRS